MRFILRLTVAIACLLQCASARRADRHIRKASYGRADQALPRTSLLPRDTTPLHRSSRTALGTTVLPLRGGAALVTDESMNKLLTVIDLAGTGVFAFSGAVTGARKGMDLLGVIIVSIISAVGGGTTRDVLLDSGTVFWMKDALYLNICVITAVLTFFFWPTLEEQFGWKDSAKPICTADALGLGAFCVIGTQKAISLGMGPPVQIASGLVTCCFGGIIRDVLCLQPPRVLYPYRTLYATPPLLGSITYVLLTNLTGLTIAEATLISSVLTFCARVMSFNSPRRLPYWKNNLSEKLD